MPRRLQCLAGPSPDDLLPISVNSSQAHPISSDLFEGKVSVFIKLDSNSSCSSPSGSRRKVGSVELDHDYFSRPERKGVTWSIQVQGRFLEKFTADDVLFGNTFDRPLKLPWGSGAVLKFMNIIDPTLEHDLGGPKPWALSPLISTMPYFHHQRTAATSPLNSFPAEESISDYTKHLKSSKPLPERVFASSQDRRVFFSNARNRKDVTFGPRDVISTDFCYGFLKFPELYLNLPAGISFDLKKYWDGQPVRFVCCERDGPRTFWCVVFEIIDDDDEEEEEMEEEEMVCLPRM